MNNMEREFVPYELAVSLKALGFDEPCFAWYVSKEHGLELGSVIKSDLIKEGLLAPIYSQAFRWVMQFPPLNKWACNIALYSDGTYSIKDGKYAVHEYLSSEECLDKLIEIVESEKK